MTAEDHGKDSVRSLTERVRDRRSTRRLLSSELISVANIVRAPILDSAGVRVGRVNDVVVRWTTDMTYPPVTALLVRVDHGFAVLPAADADLTQSQVRLAGDRHVLARAVRGPGDVALVRDVLDHQLVDVEGVQVVRAADVYLVKGRRAWELAGIDVSVKAFLRRLGPRRHRCPTPGRMIAWEEVQSFASPTKDSEPFGEPTADAGIVGSAVKARVPVPGIRKLRAREIATLLEELDRDRQVQTVSMISPATAAEALQSLTLAQRSALLAQLSDEDRTRLEALISGNDAE